MARLRAATRFHLLLKAQRPAYLKVAAEKHVQQDIVSVVVLGVGAGGRTGFKLYRGLKKS